MDEEDDPEDDPLPSERFFGPRDVEGEIATEEEPPIEEWDGAYLSGEVDPDWLWLQSRNFEYDEVHGAWFDV